MRNHKNKLSGSDMGQFHLPDVTKFFHFKVDGAIYFFMATKSLRSVLLLLSDKSSVDLGLFFSCYEQAYLSLTR